MSATETRDINDLRAESMLLGTMLRDQTAVAEAAPLLDEEHFSVREHGVVFGAMKRCLARGKVDIVSVTEQLREDGRLEEAGGPARVAGLVDGIPAGINVESVVRAILNASARRKLHETLSRGIDQLKSGKHWRSVASEANGEFSVIQDGASIDGISTVGDGVAHVLNDAADAASRGERPGLDTGLLVVDHILGGMQPGDLIYVAARPSQGKSAFMNQVILNAARQGKKVCAFSVEMSRAKQACRLLAAVSGVNSTSIRSGALTPAQWMLVAKAAIEIKKLPIWIDDSRPLTVGQIAARARRLNSEVGLDLIAVDYVQLVKSGLRRTKTDEQHAEITNVSHALKDIAGELKVPVLALCQMNRNVETGTERRPRLSDLGGSGSLEQDADVVSFLWKVLDDAGAETGEVETIIAKSRDGATGSARSIFIRHMSTFANAEPELLPA